MSALELLAVGDIFLQTRTDKYPFENVGSILKGKDILFGNLETVLSKRGNPLPKRVSLRTDPEKVRYLMDAGFSIVNIANNHIMDYGELGLLDTIDVLEKSGIQFVGAGRNIGEAISPITFEKNDARLGFVGFTSAGITAGEKNCGCAPANKELLIECVRKLREEVDILVVSLHWGIEYVFYPSPGQQNLARELIDNGADLILGHHPHVIQGIEEYKGRPIFYSLGNCNFRTEQDKNYGGADAGVIASIEFSSEGITNYELVPIRINSDCTPVLLQGDEKSKALEFIAKISEPLQSEITSRLWYEEASTVYLSSQVESYLIRIRRYGVSHLVAFLRWLVTPFTLRMICGGIRRKVREITQSGKWIVK